MDPDTLFVWPCFELNKNSFNLTLVFALGSCPETPDTLSDYFIR